MERYMAGRLDGRVAIVTGGGGGIGRQFALLLASEGASVLVNDLGTRTGADAASVVAEIEAAGGRAVADTNSATWSGADAIVRHAIDAFGRVDMLFNNATAGGHPAHLWEVTEEAWDTSFEVNVKGYFAMIRAVALHFIRQRSGVILNMSSGAGFGHPAMQAYASTKEAVIGLTRTVARELGRFGVRCNAIRPLALAQSSDEYMVVMAPWLKLLALTTGGGGIRPEESGANPTTHPPAKIAPMGVWLATDAAKEVNGRTFHVRGDNIALFNEPTYESSIGMPGGWTLDALDAEAPEGLFKGVTNDFLLNDHPDLQHFEEAAE
ncbi:SDR family NAD(P)-dependent oxidoreductase [Sphingomonas montanisoli]|uniref:SDR family NAD(P)-dependent oxidoreductase n=2 Tax=Sphingomonas montanisoli TaxID=2606412 RepID=A0A5D9C8I6_9SPHN|nr:SDR family NAD(P)-dependent oxidoreductase [Sphingomonas montanisoli]